MSFVYCGAGEETILEWAFKSTGENLTLKLFSNDATSPSDSSVAVDFTVATFTGYTDKTLTRSSFNSATSSSGVASISYPELDWTATSTQTIYGYAVYDSLGNLIGAEKFEAVENMTSGKTFRLTVTFSLNTAA